VFIGKYSAVPHIQLVIRIEKYTCNSPLNEIAAISEFRPGLLKMSEFRPGGVSTTSEFHPVGGVASFEFRPGGNYIN